MATVPCPQCEEALPLPELFARDLCYVAQCRLFVALCPRCGKGLEFQVASDRIEFGFTYAAGSMHFEGMRSHHVADLGVIRDGAGAVILHAGKRYRARS